MGWHISDGTIRLHKAWKADATNKTGLAGVSSCSPISYTDLKARRSGGKCVISKRTSRIPSKLQCPRAISSSNICRLVTNVLMPLLVESKLQRLLGPLDIESWPRDRRGSGPVNSTKTSRGSFLLPLRPRSLSAAMLFSACRLHSLKKRFSFVGLVHEPWGVLPHNRPTAIR